MPRTKSKPKPKRKAVVKKNDRRQSSKGTVGRPRLNNPERTVRITLSVTQSLYQKIPKQNISRFFRELAEENLRAG